MNKLKKTLMGITFIFMICILVISANCNVKAATKSYVTEKNFKGYLYPQGKDKDSLFNMEILSIKKGKVKFWIDKSTYSVVDAISTISSTIKGDKASFSFTDDWGNKGKGTLTFKKNKTVVLNLKTTKPSSYARTDMNCTNLVMGKTNTTVQVYRIKASDIKAIGKSGDKLKIKSNKKILEGPLTPIPSIWSFSMYKYALFPQKNTSIAYKLTGSTKFCMAGKNDYFKDSFKKSSYTKIKEMISSKPNSAVYVYVRNKKIEKVVGVK